VLRVPQVSALLLLLLLLLLLAVLGCQALAG
jgi:hypothetical protein